MITATALCDAIAATLSAGLADMRVEVPARLSEKPVDTPLIQVLPRRCQVSGYGGRTTDRLTFTGAARVWVWNVNLYVYVRPRGVLAADLERQMGTAEGLDGVLVSQREGELFGHPRVQAVMWSWEFRTLRVADGAEYAGLLYDLTIHSY